MREVQENRKRQARARLDEAASQYIRGVREHRHNAWEPENFGFEFSLSEIEVRALDISPNLFAEVA
ncbi:MAG TPA: hypothetical protein VH601_20770 [Bryobacteraceae bacterium]